MRTMMGKKLALATVASLALVTAACGSTDDDGDTDTGSSSSEQTTDTASDAGEDLVGPGCADYASQVPDGEGSIDGMAQDTVTVAASNNPLLTTLVAAVSGQVNPDVDLVDTLNGGEWTIFAPVDSAFDKLDADTMAAIQTPEGAETLASVLTYHVIEGQTAPDDIDGTFTTVNGADLTVSGSGDEITVGDQAAVICGGVKTANATVYLIDTVLMPPAA